MPSFVHLAPESMIRAIEKNGIAPRSKHQGLNGLYAMPVTRNFYASHQWLRELRRRGTRALAAVYFRIPDDENVVVGHYRQAHQEMTAAAAAGLIDELAPAEGFEVFIKRRITPKELSKVKSLPQVIGWRFYPEAKGKKPFCTCEFCIRGEIRASRFRDTQE